MSSLGGSPDDGPDNSPDNTPDRGHASGWPDKLVYMANQIGRFFAHQGDDKAVAEIADHLTKFWEPRMRAAILRHLDEGGAGLDRLPRQAVERLRTSTATKSGAA